jgi:hypothetical protein
MTSEVFHSVLLFFLFPERKVLLEKLNDGLSISESLLINVIDLLEGVRQSLLSKSACFLVVVHHFVMEHREIEGESKSDWVASVQAFRSALGKLIVLEGSVLDSIQLISLGTFSNVSVVISDHLVEEGFGLVGGGNSHAGVLHNVDNADALVIKFLLNFLLVDCECFIELGVFRVLLDSRNGPDGSSL